VNETVNIASTITTRGATLGSPNTAVLTIVDNETAPAGTLQLSSSPTRRSSDLGNATITVTRTGGSAGAVGVTFATSNGTATAGSDYKAGRPTVSFSGRKAADISISNTNPHENPVLRDENAKNPPTKPPGGATLG